MTNTIRKQAIDRGLDFIYQTACKRAYFDEYGFDYLGCFHCLASTSKDRGLRKKALDLGRERALEWRRRNARVPRKAEPGEIVMGSYAAHSLGLPDEPLKQELRKAASQFTATDYFYFDPAADRRRSRARPASAARPFGHGVVRGQEQGMNDFIRGFHGVRYQVKDVSRSIDFYTQHLGFKLEHKQLPAFAALSLEALPLLLSGPGASGSRQLPTGERQEPGGWNRIVIRVADLPQCIQALKEAGFHFRNEMEAGPGGRQIQLLDPDDNPIELFEPAQ